MENIYQEVITEEARTKHARNQQVIIPNHVRVSEEDCTMLSFGSFDFVWLLSNFRTEMESISPPLEEGTDKEDLGVTTGSFESSMSTPQD